MDKRKLPDLRYFFINYNVVNMPERKYPTYSVKLMIIADHGGRCAFCGLNSGRRIYTTSKEEPPLDNFDVGQIAHIYSENREGPRYDPEIPEEFIASKENYLLLCTNHHSQIDNNPKKYPAKKLLQKRKEHANLVDSRLNVRDIEKVIVITLWDDYFGKINTSTIQNTLKDTECVVNYLDFHTETKNTENINWIDGCSSIANKWREFKEDFLSNVSTLVDGYHIYGITQIPFAFFFGLLIKDTNKIWTHQWNRENQNWEGFSRKNPNENIKVESKINDQNASDIILKIELTTRINNNYISKLNIETKNVITMKNSDLCQNWLKSIEQTELILMKYRETMQNINNLPGQKRVYLFYSGPIPPLIKMGAFYNPRIDPQMNIYYFGFDPQSGEKGYQFAFNTKEILQSFQLL